VDVQLYRVLDAASGLLICLMLLFSPWAFGTTQLWAIWTMNLAGYALGALLAYKLFIRHARGYRAVIVMPDNQSAEKYQALEALGVDLRKVKAVPYADNNHYQRVAGRLGADLPGAIWANQFDNIANREGHYRTTGPEILADAGGRLDAFVAATGTGGTLGGVGRYLKENAPGVRIVLADPQGSSLFNWVKTGELKPNGSGSITEGIGIGRVTANLHGTPIDTAVPIADPEVVETVYRLLYREGLFLGSASGVNVAAAMRTARELGPGHTIVTILRDGGQRYQSRLYSRAWLAKKGLAEAAEAGRRAPQP